MKRIDISVKNLVAWQTNTVEYVCGNSEFTINFDFDEEWTEGAKTARFSYNGEYTDIVFTGNECEVPVILNTTRLEVGVFAGNLKTSTSAAVSCKKGTLCKSGTPADPKPDVYNQIMELLNQGSGGNANFETDETLKLENGILSVNTTNAMEQDNTLPITSAGVYATVGNIEALLQTI